MKILDRLFPRRFVSHSLATHLAGPFAIAPHRLRHAVDDAQGRLALTDGATIRALAMRPPEAREGLLALEPLGVELPGDEDDGEELPSEEHPLYCARIPVVGTIVRGDASCARMLGVEAVGLEEIEHAIQEAIANPQVREICFEVTSPGGTATGVQEIVDLIAASPIPVRAEIAGECCSAAYWLISGCSEIVAEPSALVGSIGAYAVVADTSKAAADEGVTVHVIRSGPQKGAGTPGTEITPDQITAIQGVVDDLAAMFARAVATGRRLSPEAVAELATGDVWITEKAIARGLVDRVTTPELPLGQTAPRGAQENSMENKPSVSAGASAGPDITAIQAQIADLTARAEKAETKNAALEATLVEVRKAQAAEIIEKHAKAGRVVPAARDQIEKLATSAPYASDPSALDALLATFPVVTRPVAAGAAPTDSDPTTSEHDPAVIAQVAKFTGRTVEQVLASAKVVAISADGKEVTR